MESPKAGTGQGSQDAQLHFLDYWRIIRIRKTIILAVFLLVVITVTAVTLTLPQVYMSTARMRVEKDTADITPFGGGPVQQFDAYFLATEFEVFKSRMILDRVVEELNLAALYAERFKMPGQLTVQQAYDVVYDNVDIKQFRSTSIIEISAYDRDKVKAQEIANTIAKVYRKYRFDQRKERQVRGLTTLTNELEQIGGRIRTAQEAVDKLRKDLNVADPTLAGAVVQSMSSQTMSRLESNRTELKATYRTFEALLMEIRKRTKDATNLRRFLAVARPTPELSTLLGKLNDAEQRRVALNPDLGPEHPETKRILGLIAIIDSQLDLEVQGIISALETQLKTTQLQLEALEEEYKSTLEKTNMEFAKLAPYARAKEELDTLIRLRDAMQLQLSQATVDSAISKEASVQIIDGALPGLRPVKPSRTLNISLGAVFGLLLGVGLAFFIEYLDTSVKTIDDVEQALGAPVLGVIPQNVRSLLEEGADSPHAEAYRVLRTNILFSRKNQEGRTMTVVSGGAGEGKSTTIFNLATIFAQQGARVLIVDSDLRRPSLHKILKLSNSAGLTNYLLKQNKLEEVIQTTPQPGLDFLPSGKLPSSSLGILNSVQMREFVQEARSRYDFVFFDSPPIMGVSDASVLASEVDMAILVVQYRKYPLQMTLRAKQMVEKIGGPGRLLGVVLNNINISQDSYYYYYSGYYYDYYSRTADAKEKKDKDRSGEKGTEKGKARAAVSAREDADDDTPEGGLRKKF
ncbi:MAG: GumC family protein [Verrucomicrobiota bacterium]